MSSPRSEFIQGMKDISPILLGVVPFGLIAGVTAVSVGLSVAQAIGMSFFVVAGAAQLAALELIQNGALVGIILLTVGIINLRHVMYSATLAPHLRDLSFGWRLFLPYLMVDQVFLLSSLRYNKEPDMPYKRWYYLGLAFAILTVWHSSSIVGALLGTQIPPAWGLDFTIPLVFMVLIFPSITDRPTLLAAIVGGIVAVLLRDLPFNLGFIIAALLGILSGIGADQLTGSHKEVPA